MLTLIPTLTLLTLLNPTNPNCQSAWKPQDATDRRKTPQDAAHPMKNAKRNMA